MEKLIITIAPTGNVPTKEMNPHVPLTVEEIVSDIGRCHEAGASSAHIHGRDEQLPPTSGRRVFERIIGGLAEKGIDIIKQASTAISG